MAPKLILGASKLILGAYKHIFGTSLYNLRTVLPLRLISPEIIVWIPKIHQERLSWKWNCISPWNRWTMVSGNSICWSQHRVIELVFAFPHLLYEATAEPGLPTAWCPPSPVSAQSSSLCHVHRCWSYYSWVSFQRKHSISCSLLFVIDLFIHWNYRLDSKNSPRASELKVKLHQSLAPNELHLLSDDGPEETWSAIDC